MRTLLSLSCLVATPALAGEVVFADGGLVQSVRIEQSLDAPDFAEVQITMFGLQGPLIVFFEETENGVEPVRMEGSLGADFSDVRVHAGTTDAGALVVAVEQPLSIEETPDEVVLLAPLFHDGDLQVVDALLPEGVRVSAARSYGDATNTTPTVDSMGGFTYRYLPLLYGMSEPE